LNTTLKLNQSGIAPGMSNSKTFKVLFALVSVLLFSKDSFTQQPKVNLLSANTHIVSATEKIQIQLRDSLIETISELINRSEYDMALKSSEYMRKMIPDDPSGYLLAADTYQSFMREYRLNIYEDNFEEYINKTVKVGEAALAREPSAENHFVLGATEGYRCLHWFRSGKWFKAIKAIRRSVKLLNTALELDSTFVDPLLGLALYEYAKSKLSVFGLGLFGDKTEKVISFLKRVENESRFVSTEAQYMLQLVYFEIGDLEKAYLYNTILLERFPNNLVNLYFQALILKRWDRLEESEKVWQEIIVNINEFEEQSHGFLAEVYYHLADIYYQTGQQEKSWKDLRQSAKHIHRYQEEREFEGLIYSYKALRNEVNDAFKKWEWNWAQ
jgi:tetratricopeptide (TPR) repeat protein